MVRLLCAAALMVAVLVGCGEEWGGPGRVSVRNQSDATVLVRMAYRDPSPAETVRVWRADPNSAGWLIWAVANTSVIEVLEPGSCDVRAAWAGELPVVVVNISPGGEVEFEESATDSYLPDERFGWVRECGGEPQDDIGAPQAS